MRYNITGDKIEIFGKEDFCARDILECGQIFMFKKLEKTDFQDNYVVYSQDKKAEIFEKADGYVIKTKDPRYFEYFFDLKTDYAKIKAQLSQYAILKHPVEYGKGIRILNQNLFETLISFIVSANNNIKRIQLILNRLRNCIGEKIDDFYAFPTRERLLEKDENFFKSIGAGYRANYLFKVVRQVDESRLEEWASLDTEALRKQLLTLCGVGPKVADCILLFGYHRMDVFPVDTWIHKMYNRYYYPLDDREKIRNNLLKEFGDLSGYAQQYLFYSMREKESF